MAVRISQDARSHQDYRVGWICALPTEMAAATCMLEERHPALAQPDTDDNNYALGRIGQHNIVIACLPSGLPGTTSAARVSLRLRTTFPMVRFGLMVGIGGGAPSEAHDIRLGDVVVSRPEGLLGGVIQYDFGKTVQGGRFVQTGSLNRPPDVLPSAMAKLQAHHMMEDSRIPALLEQVIARYPRRSQACTYPGMHLDQLFHWSYAHARPQSEGAGGPSFWAKVMPEAQTSCSGCDPSKLILRTTSRDPPMAIHYGLIASANQVMRDGVTRERLRKEKDILCFEMEAAGIMDDFPCLVVRGVSDYADSHKHKHWQDFAAATAAAYAAELLSFVPVLATNQASGSQPSQTVIHRAVGGKETCLLTGRRLNVIRSCSSTLSR